MKGAASATAASLGLLVGLNRGPVSGWTSPIVIMAFAAVPVALWWLVRVERKAAQPLLPLALLRRRNFSFAIVDQLFVNFAYMGGFILTPLLLERVYRESVATAGLVVVVRPLVFSLTAPLAGYAAARVGNRVAAGGVVLTGLVVAFVFASPASGLGLVVVGLALSGLASAPLAPALAASVANSVDDDNLGAASAAGQLIGQIGTVAGIQVLQTVQASSQSSAGILGSFHAAFLVAAGAGVVAVACGAGLLGRHADAAAVDELEAHEAGLVLSDALREARSAPAAGSCSLARLGQTLAEHRHPLPSRVQPSSSRARSRSRDIALRRPSRRSRSSRPAARTGGCRAGRGGGRDRYVLRPGRGSVHHGLLPSAR